MLHERTPDYAVFKSLAAAVGETITPLVRKVEPAALREALMHTVSGGKRIRPILTMLSCAAIGGNLRDALHAATAIELLHTSSLVHDDIMDRAETRRGVPSVYSLYGNSMAILAGDALIALAFQSIQKNTFNKERVLDRFTNAFLHTCEGQGYDLMLPHSSTTGLQGHRLMVEKKTACLMEAAASIGALVGTTNEDHIRALGRFGFDLGMAFQAKDDLLDLVGDEKTLGKPVKADKRNGKMTFVSPGPITGEAQGVPVVIRADDHVQGFTNSACEALDVLPPAASREHLRALADLLLERED